MTGQEHGRQEEGILNALLSIFAKQEFIPVFQDFLIFQGIFSPQGA